MGGIFGGGGGSSSSSQSASSNSTSVDVTSQVQVVNEAVDLAPLVTPLQTLTDAISGVETQRAESVTKAATTLKDAVDKVTETFGDAQKTQLLLGVAAVAAAYYGARRR